MSRTQTIIETLLPTVAGAFLAVQGNTDASTILGACIAGSGIMSILGMFLSEAITALKVSRLTGYRRMLANWLCGLFSIPFVGYMHRHWFPDEDLAFTAAGIAGIFALLGVSVFAIAIPKLLRLFSKGVDTAEETAEKWIPNVKKPPQPGSHPIQNPPTVNSGKG